LTVEYLEAQLVVDPIIEKLVTRGDLNEVLYLAFATSRHQDSIIGAVLAQVGGTEDARLDLVLRTCLQRRPPRYDATDVLQNWLLKCVRDQMHFVLSEALLGYMQPRTAFITELLTQFDKAFKEKHQYAFALCCSLLFAFGGGQLSTAPVSSMVGSALSSPELLPIVLRNAVRDRWRALLPHLDMLLESHDALGPLSFVGCAREFVEPLN
jgi:hypothetical protein